MNHSAEVACPHLCLVSTVPWARNKLSIRTVTVDSLPGWYSTTVRVYFKLDILKYTFLEDVDFNWILKDRVGYELAEVGVDIQDIW